MYRLIYFFGPDGTGKTTHADLIAARLRSMGFKVWRTSVKQHHTIAHLILKLMEKAGYDIRMINYYGFYKELANKMNLIWKFIEIISFFIAWIYRIYLPYLLGYIVVCDRYVLDTLVTLSYFLKEPKFITSKFARLLIKLIPKNSLLFYLEADTRSIVLRKLDEPLTLELIEYYKRMYALLIKIYGIKVNNINTESEAVQSVHKKIAGLLGISG
ncbi:MAG: hypothetical protein QXY55_06285 [Candidatus Korarchaeota archaeon]